MGIDLHNCAAQSITKFTQAQRHEGGENISISLWPSCLCEYREQEDDAVEASQPACVGRRSRLELVNDAERHEYERAWPPRWRRYINAQSGARGQVRCWLSNCRMTRRCCR